MSTEDFQGKNLIGFSGTYLACPETPCMTGERSLRLLMPAQLQRQRLHIGNHFDLSLAFLDLSFFGLPLPLPLSFFAASRRVGAMTASASPDLSSSACFP